MDTRKLLALLRRRNRSNAADLDRRVDARAGVERAILVGDSSGFSRKTHEYGILQFLAVMTRCYDRMVPILRRRGGRVFSIRADNLLAVFDDAPRAVAAAVDVQRWLRTYNRGRRADERFHFCIGIDAGRVIELEDDVYGAAVNVASKVGEDLAARDEILVTSEIARRVDGRFRCGYSRSAEIGGRLFELHRVRV